MFSTCIHCMFDVSDRTGESRMDCRATVEDTVYLSPAALIHVASLKRFLGYYTCQELFRQTKFEQKVNGLRWTDAAPKEFARWEVHSPVKLAAPSWRLWQRPCCTECLETPLNDIHGFIGGIAACTTSYIQFCARRVSWRSYDMIWCNDRIKDASISRGLRN